MKKLGSEQYQAEVVKVFSNTYILRLNPLPDSWVDGMKIQFLATEDSTGLLYVNLKGRKENLLGAKRVVTVDGSPTASGDVTSGQLISLLYDASNVSCVLQSSLSYSPPSNSSTNGVSFPGSGAVATIAHGLGSLPKWVRVVVYNTSTTEQGYVANDELGIESLQKAGSQNQAFAVSCDATNVYVAQIDSANLEVIPRSGGGYSGITESNWKIKVYASL